MVVRGSFSSDPSPILLPTSTREERKMQRKYALAVAVGLVPKGRALVFRTKREIPATSDRWLLKKRIASV